VTELLWSTIVYLAGDIDVVIAPLCCWSARFSSLEEFRTISVQLFKRKGFVLLCLSKFSFVTWPVLISDDTRLGDLHCVEGEV
jgi:hypothetical protein